MPSPRTRREVIVSFSALSTVIASLVLASAPTASAAVECQPPDIDGHVVCTYLVTGAATWVVPAGVTTATFTLYGGQGGRQFTTQPAGGLGAQLVATLPVSEGESYALVVAGMGGTGSSGGGVGGGGNTFAFQSSGAGGGASSVSLAGARLLVAGGGGGTGSASGGGGDSGSPGDNGASDTNGTLTITGGGGGGAGTQAAGGTGGTRAAYQGSCIDAQFPGIAGLDGSAGQGGTGGHVSGGGGGGGYFGGGGGGGSSRCGTPQVQSSAGGGGGGSSFADEAATDVTLTDGTNEGHGVIEIEYDIVDEAVLQPQTITFGELDRAVFGDPPFTLTATASSGLPVTYAVDDEDDECTVSGSTVTIVHAGSCWVTAYQPGDETYAAAEPVARNLRIDQLSTSLILSAPSTLAFGETGDLRGSAHHSTLPSSASVTSLTPELCSASLGRFGDGGVTALASSGTCEVELDATDTRDVNYSSSTREITLTKAGQSISFDELTDRVLGDPAFEVSATATSDLSVTFSAEGQCSLSGTTVTLADVGTCSITASQAGDGNYLAAQDVVRSFDITAGIELGDPSPQPVQYSDELTVSASVAGGAGSVAFTLDGAAFCTVTVVAGEASCTDEVTLPVGIYDLEATFTPDDTTRGSVAATGSVEVVAEDADARYSGPQFVSTGSATATSTTISLTAQVDQAGDGDAGDITKAKMFFDLYKSTNLGSTPDFSVAGTVDSAGVARASKSLALDNYVVIVRFDDAAQQYFDGPASDATVLTVYAPTSGIWATGGGWVVDPSTSDIPVALSEESNHGSFGFNVRYSSTKKGAAPQGQSVYAFHGSDGYDYVVKSTSWQGGSAAFGATTAGFSAKATVMVFDPATGTTVAGLGGGNFTLRVDVVDGGQSGANDKYALSVYNAKGKLYHQVGTTRTPLPLGGGNITVHK